MKINDVKRIVGIILTVCIIFSAMSVGALAASGNTYINIDNEIAASDESPDSGNASGISRPVTADARNFTTGVYCTDVTMNFRSKPTTESAIITSIPFGTVLTVTEIYGSWGKTTYNGNEGWLSLEWSTLITAPEKEVNWLTVDVSKWQSDSDINWAKLKAAGVECAILRIGGRGYGSSKAIYDDTAFMAHYNSAKAAGMHVGVYFFSYALNTAQANEEAQYVIDTLKANNCQLDMPVFIDIEDDDGDSQRQHTVAGKAVCTNVVNAFCARIESAGYYAGIYCNKFFADDLISPSAFNGRAAWIAHYASACGYTGRYDMWQYTKLGRIDGFKYDIDLSYCYVDFPKLIKENGYNGYQSETPVSGHNSSGLQVTKAATCEEDGEKTAVCTDCAVTLQKEIFYASGHTESAQCAILGNNTVNVGDICDTSRSYFYNSANIDYFDTIIQSLSQEGGCLLTFCTVCKKVLSTEYYYADSACTHGSVHTETVSPTCAGGGKQTEICSACGKTVSEKYLTKLNHTPGTEEYYAPTCLSDGNNSVKCTGCGKTISYTFTAVGTHNFSDWSISALPTLSKTGLRQRSCGTCGQTEYENLGVIIPGDADRNGEIASADARLALRQAVSLESLDAVQSICADINQDGTVTAADARLILRLAVGLENLLEITATYYSR